MYHPLVGMNTTFSIHLALPLPARAFVPLAAVPSGRGTPPQCCTAAVHTHTMQACCQPASMAGCTSRACVVMFGTRCGKSAGVTCGAAARLNATYCLEPPNANANATGGERATHGVE